MRTACDAPAKRRDPSTARRDRSAKRGSGARRRVRSPSRAAPDLDRPPVASPAPSRSRRRSSGSACLRSGRGPPSALVAAGASAARALADLPVEFVAGDPAALAARLGPRLALAPPLAPGLRLVGARLAPGSQATATLYLYENSRGERVALMVEPLDETVAAPARRSEADGLSVAAWTGAGYGFVAAAAEDADVAALVAAAGADDDSLADAGAQRR